MKNQKEKQEIESGDLYDQIDQELDHVGGMLHMVECLAGSAYQEGDNSLETLLAEDQNGFMTLMYTTMQHFEEARELLKELFKRIPDEATARKENADHAKK